MTCSLKLEEILAGFAELDRKEKAIKSIGGLLSKFMKDVLRDNPDMETGETKFVFDEEGLEVTWYVSLTRLGEAVGAPLTVKCGGNQPIRLGVDNIPLDQVRLIYASLEALMNWACEEFGLAYHFHALKEAAS